MTTGARARRLLAALAALALGVAPLATPLSAQPSGTPRSAAPDAPQPDIDAGDDLDVMLATIGQGDLVWERFGHNALIIRDRSTGQATAWNWGVFDFDAVDFLPRLIRGEWRYWMEGMDAKRMLDYYASDNRDIVLQELNLTPAQERELLAFVRWNERPENRHYRYDYYLDNCSTRVRDAIDRVLGGQIRAATDTVVTATTFRQETRRLTGDQPLTYAGIMLALGNPADRPITVWEDMFLPVRMQVALRAVTVRGPDGAPVPLVKSERPYFESTRPPEPAEPPGFQWGYLVGGLALAALLAGLAERARLNGRAARRTLAALGSAWSLVAGIAGSLLVYVWLGTRHSFMYQNENLFLFQPLSLLLAVLLPRYLAGRGGRGAARLAAAIAGLALLGAALHVLLPGLRQVNGELVALALPAHLALAWALYRVRTARVSGPAAAGAPAAGDRPAAARVSSTWS